MTNLKKLGFGAGLLAATGSAFAQADVSAATSALADAATAIGLIGVAMLAAASAGIVYRWVTAFLVK